MDDVGIETSLLSLFPGFHKDEKGSLSDSSELPTIEEVLDEFVSDLKLLLFNLQHTKEYKTICQNSTKKVSLRVHPRFLKEIPSSYTVLIFKLLIAIISKIISLRSGDSLGPFLANNDKVATQIISLGMIGALKTMDQKNCSRLCQFIKHNTGNYPSHINAMFEALLDAKETSMDNLAKVVKTLIQGAFENVRLSLDPNFVDVEEGEYVGPIFVIDFTNEEEFKLRMSRFATVISTPLPQINYVHCLIFIKRIINWLIVCLSVTDRLDEAAMRKDTQMEEIACNLKMLCFFLYVARMISGFFVLDSTGDGKDERVKSFVELCSILHLLVREDRMFCRLIKIYIIVNNGKGFSLFQEHINMLMFGIRSNFIALLKFMIYHCSVMSLDGASHNKGRVRCRYYDKKCLMKNSAKLFSLEKEQHAEDGEGRRNDVVSTIFPILKETETWSTAMRAEAYLQFQRESGQIELQTQIQNTRKMMPQIQIQQQSSYRSEVMGGQGFYSKRNPLERQITSNTSIVSPAFPYSTSQYVVIQQQVEAPGLVRYYQPGRVSIVDRRVLEELAMLEAASRGWITPHDSEYFFIDLDNKRSIRQIIGIDSHRPIKKTGCLFDGTTGDRRENIKEDVLVGRLNGRNFRKELEQLELVYANRGSPYELFKRYVTMFGSVKHSYFWDFSNIVIGDYCSTHNEDDKLYACFIDKNDYERDLELLVYSKYISIHTASIKTILMSSHAMTGFGLSFPGKARMKDGSNLEEVLEQFSSAAKYNLESMENAFIPYDKKLINSNTFTAAMGTMSFLPRDKPTKKEIQNSSADYLRQNAVRSQTLTTNTNRPTILSKEGTQRAVHYTNIGQGGVNMRATEVVVPVEREYLSVPQPVVRKPWKLIDYIKSDSIDDIPRTVSIYNTPNRKMRFEFIPYLRYWTMFQKVLDTIWKSGNWELSSYIYKLMALLITKTDDWEVQTILTGEFVVAVNKSCVLSKDSDVRRIALFYKSMRKCDKILRVSSEIQLTLARTVFGDVPEGEDTEGTIPKYEVNVLGLIIKKIRFYTSEFIDDVIVHAGLLRQGASDTTGAPWNTLNIVVEMTRHFTSVAKAAVGSIREVLLVVVDLLDEVHHVLGEVVSSLKILQRSLPGCEKTTVSKFGSKIRQAMKRLERLMVKIAIEYLRKYELNRVSASHLFEIVVQRACNHFITANDKLKWNRKFKDRNAQAILASLREDNPILKLLILFTLRYYKQAVQNAQVEVKYVSFEDSESADLNADICITTILPVALSSLLELSVIHYRQKTVARASLNALDAFVQLVSATKGFPMSILRRSLLVTELNVLSLLARCNSRLSWLVSNSSVGKMANILSNIHKLSSGSNYINSFEYRDLIGELGLEDICVEHLISLYRAHHLLMSRYRRVSVKELLSLHINNPISPPVTLSKSVGCEEMNVEKVWDGEFSKASNSTSMTNESHNTGNGFPNQQLNEPTNSSIFKNERVKNISEHIIPAEHKILWCAEIRREVKRTLKTIMKMKQSEKVKIIKIRK